MMWTALIFTVTALTWGCHAELVMEVTPEFVDPDVTPSFSLNCALLEYEEAGVVSLSISKVVTPATATTPAVTEEIASLGSLNPNLPTVSAAYPQLTVLGQITTFEAELGTYLNVVWPNPTVEELGLYQCDAKIVAIGVAGAVAPLTIQARVTTGNPMIDRLLKKVDALEKSVQSLNETSTDLQAQLDNVTTREAEREAEKEAEKASATTTASPVVEAITVASSETTTVPTAETTVSGDSDEELTEVLDMIMSKMQRFNETLFDMEQRLEKLELEELREQNETDSEVEQEEPGVDQIVEYFVAGNSSYFLIQAGQPTDSYRAEADCERRGLYLADIDDKNEFTAVTDAILPFVEMEGSQVLVAGTRRPGRVDWVFPNSGEKVSFFQWGPGQPEAPSRSADCMVLNVSTGVVEMASVSCSADQSELYYLCESS